MLVTCSQTSLTPEPWAKKCCIFSKDNPGPVASVSVGNCVRHVNCMSHSTPKLSCNGVLTSSPGNSDKG
jgi:hypothetical protein